MTDIGALGLVQHDSSDGTGSIDRIRSFFTESSYVGENISFGSQQGGYDPLVVMINLIVDDGVPSRGHRNLIFNADM